MGVERRMAAAAAVWTRRVAGLVALGALISGAPGLAQAIGGSAGAPPTSTPEVYKPIDAFDMTSIDKTADPCTDFYKFACGKFEANHPIPGDQGGVDQFYALYNVNTQSLRGILEKASAGGATRSPASASTTGSSARGRRGGGR